MAVRFGYVDTPTSGSEPSNYPLATLDEPVWASSNDAYARISGQGGGASAMGSQAAPFILSNRHGIAVLGHAEEYVPEDEASKTDKKAAPAEESRS